MNQMQKSHPFNKVCFQTEQSIGRVRLQYGQPWCLLTVASSVVISCRHGTPSSSVFKCGFIPAIPQNPLVWMYVIKYSKIVLPLSVARSHESLLWVFKNIFRYKTGVNTPLIENSLDATADPAAFCPVQGWIAIQLLHSKHSREHRSKQGPDPCPKLISLLVNCSTNSNCY